jgi:S1-C subfamily serine protease
LIKVKETDGLPKGISLTDSDKMEEGDKIFVIGNPAGFELSLSEGIVSGKRNIDPITQSPREIIQMTAPI